MKHLHHRIPRCRTGHHRSFGQHHSRNGHTPAHPAIGSLVRPVGSYLIGRRDEHGHHPAQHYPVHRTTICAPVHLPRFRDRLHRPLPRHPLVRISVASLRRMVTYLLTMRLRLNLRQTPTSTHSYGEGVGGGELMGLRTMVKKGNFSARLSAQNLEKNTSKTTFLNIR